MTINQLIYFQTIAKLENYRKAADELYISQPSLSRSIASLEEELGLKLFEKDGRGIVLTKSGKLFLEYTNRILKSYNIAKKKMQNMREDGGKIDIGYVFPLAEHYIPHYVRRFLDDKQNKNVIFSFYQNHTAEITKKVLDGELDIGFGGYMNEDDLEYFPIYSQKIVMITPKDHPLASKREASIFELTQYPVIGYDSKSWLGNYTRNLYKQMNMEPNIIVECPDEYSISAFVSEGFGIAIVPQLNMINPEKVNIIPLDDINLIYEVNMFWVRDRYQIPAVQNFIDYMKVHSKLVKE